MLVAGDHWSRGRRGICARRKVIDLEGYGGRTQLLSMAKLSSARLRIGPSGLGAILTAVLRAQPRLCADDLPLLPWSAFRDGRDVGDVNVLS